MTTFRTKENCGCQVITGVGGRRPGTCACGNRYLTEKELRPLPRTDGVPTVPWGDPPQGYEPKARRRSLKRGKGFSASNAQREKVKLLPCAYCGESPDDLYAVIDPAHLWPRGKGGCDHADCVIPLCRVHHQAFDLGCLELLPSLVTRGYWEEMAHPIRCHEVSLTVLLARLTHESASEREAA